MLARCDRACLYCPVQALCQACACAYSHFWRILAVMRMVWCSVMDRTALYIPPRECALSSQVLLWGRGVMVAHRIPVPKVAGSIPVALKERRSAHLVMRLPPGVHRSTSNLFAPRHDQPFRATFLLASQPRTTSPSPSLPLLFPLRHPVIFFTLVLKLLQFDAQDADVAGAKSIFFANRRAGSRSLRKSSAVHRIAVTAQQQRTSTA